ncbi:hypothetical protein ALC53_11833 [Atta colombica]|uniref:Uncharacterized protein n=1 Tax=Atta colombica TaxID=520822 RepID=A0A195B0K0_9HYME|nr:hypothetical protein ALC53_11833 [Atta colombica]
MKLDNGFFLCTETGKALYYASSPRRASEKTRVAEKRGSRARKVIVEYSKCTSQEYAQTVPRIDEFLTPTSAWH